MAQNDDVDFTRELSCSRIDATSTGYEGQLGARNPFGIPRRLPIHVRSSEVPEAANAFDYHPAFAVR